MPEAIFLIEFKVGETKFHQSDIEQVWDYALDLKNFHRPSHRALLVPLLVATEAEQQRIEVVVEHGDNLVAPICCNSSNLRNVLLESQKSRFTTVHIDGDQFANGEYRPTPTIIEAALSLYNTHTVDEITRNDAGAKNLTITSAEIIQLIHEAKTSKSKFICFVTGVPGAGKTLVGLKIATSQLDNRSEENCVYLSGNGPLVSILQEALTRDKVKNEKAKGVKISKKKAKASVKTFIQNIHHYRDAYLVDSAPPYDHVAIFDEAQRAWNTDHTVKFMKQKKGQSDFNYSEPEIFNFMLRPAFGLGGDSMSCWGRSGDQHR